MVANNVDELLKDHVNLEVECIDRMYFNGYIPCLQTPGSFAYFVKEELPLPIVSTAAVAPMSGKFIRNIERFAKEQDVEIVKFQKRQPKD